MNSNKNLVSTRNKYFMQNILLNHLIDFYHIRYNFLIWLSSIEKSLSESSSELLNILDNKFSISTCSTIDSKFISKEIYFNNSTSCVLTDFSNNTEVENRYFDEISKSD